MDRRPALRGAAWVFERQKGDTMVRHSRWWVGVAVVATGSVAGWWVGSRPQLERLGEVFEDPAPKLLGQAIVAHGEALYEYQAASRASVLVESARKRAIADAALDDAFLHLEMRDRSQVGTAEYEAHHRATIRGSLETIRQAAEWVQSTRAECPPER
ncbi:MAG: hypothetical protein NT069_21105 [Planctomycetota bacterium]|nr:hypothetical protein [Planctomycetota bacterium]